VDPLAVPDAPPQAGGGSEGPTDAAVAVVPAPSIADSLLPPLEVPADDYQRASAEMAAQTDRLMGAVLRWMLSVPLAVALGLMVRRSRSRREKHT
jgi:hypothetical protein